MDTTKFIQYLKSKDSITCTDIARFVNLTNMRRDNIYIFLDYLKTKLKYNQLDLRDLSLSREQVNTCIRVMDDILTALKYGSMSDSFNAYKDM